MMPYLIDYRYAAKMPPNRPPTKNRPAASEDPDGRHRQRFGRLEAGAFSLIVEVTVEPIVLEWRPLAAPALP